MNKVFGSSDVHIRATHTLYLVLIIALSLLNNVCIETRGSPSMGIPKSINRISEGKHHDPFRGWIAISIHGFITLYSYNYIQYYRDIVTPLTNM